MERRPLLTKDNTPISVDPWTSENPSLIGNNAPIHQEVDSVDIKITFGSIPDDLEGVYIRNGPNPQFKPRASYHTFGGDGMLHAIEITNNDAIYHNRWVRTDDFLLEHTKGEAYFFTYEDLVGWSGVGYMVFQLLKEKLHLGRARVLKRIANTSLAYHNGKLFALMEGDLPVQIVPPELKTVGYYDFEGQLKIGITAHPKIDADTQELVFFSYNPSKPFIHHGVVDKEGKLSSLAQVQIPRSVMMHDFAITKNYSILMDFPFYFDTKAILKKEAILTFDPSINARFGVLPRHSVDGNDIKWFQAPKTGFVYHTLGAYEEGDCIYLFACKYDRMELKPTETIPPYLIKWTFNLQTGSCDEEQLFDLPFEWPRINEAYTGIKFNYGYVLTQRPFLPKEKKPFNVICKVDVQQRTVTECPFGLGKDGGEFVFVPRRSCKSEDDGYLVGYVYDNSREISEFMIIDAIQMKILTIMELPQRVPNGFHGIFLTKQQLNQM